MRLMGCVLKQGYVCFLPFPHPPSRNVNMMVGSQAAIVDYEARGHSQGTGEP